MLQTGVYMLCPYLLTAFLCLKVVRRVRSKEVIYLCTGVAMGVSIGSLILSRLFPFCYEGDQLVWWLAAAAVLGIGTGKQCYQMIKQTEELAWNLS